MPSASDPQTGLAVLKAFLQERSPLGPLRVMAEQVGRFFQVPLPGFKPYIVYGPEANRKVLITERNKFHWRNTDPVTDLLRHGILVTDGQEHDHYRKLMEPPFHPGQLANYTHMMIAQTDRVTAQWKDGQVIDMLIEGRKIALLIILQTLLSIDAWDDLPHIWTPILKAIDYISPGPWILWRRIPRPGYKKHLQTLDTYLYKIIQDRLNAPAPHPNDLLQHLIDAHPIPESSVASSVDPSAPHPFPHPFIRSSSVDPSAPHPFIRSSSVNPSAPHPLIRSSSVDPSAPHPFIRSSSVDPSAPHPFIRSLSVDPSVDNIRDQMLTMLIAGHDTSTALLAWTFALLGQHPETLEQLTSELDSCIGESAPEAPAGWQPPLLDQVIKETLRLYPPIHIGNRVVNEDVSFGEDQTIPAGSRMFYSIYLTHRDPTIWENPNEFCPARFAHGRKTPPMSYIPFGGGPRACIGAAFGQAEARIVIARLLQTFHFELINKNIHPHMGATLEPRPGVLMKITRRQSPQYPFAK